MWSYENFFCFLPIKKTKTKTILIFQHTCTILNRLRKFPWHILRGWLLFQGFCCCSVVQLCLTLCDPMDCSPPGSSVHGILQARILEWVAISFYRGSFWPRDQTRVSYIGRQILFHWTTRVEKAMAPHSSTLAWKIPWMEEPGRLQSMGSLRVRHDWATSLSLFTFMHWRRKWQPTPVFLPGESQGGGSLMGCGLWGHPESDTTEAT